MYGRNPFREVPYEIKVQSEIAIFYKDLAYFNFKILKDSRKLQSFDGAKHLGQKLF